MSWVHDDIVYVPQSTSEKTAAATVNVVRGAQTLLNTAAEKGVVDFGLKAGLGFLMHYADNAVEASLDYMLFGRDVRVSVLREVSDWVKEPSPADRHGKRTRKFGDTSRKNHTLLKYGAMFLRVSTRFLFRIGLFAVRPLLAACEATAKIGRYLLGADVASLGVRSIFTSVYKEFSQGPVHFVGFLIGLIGPIVTTWALDYILPWLKVQLETTIWAAAIAAIEGAVVAVSGPQLLILAVVTAVVAFFAWYLTRSYGKRSLALEMSIMEFPTEQQKEDFYENHIYLQRTIEAAVATDKFDLSAASRDVWSHAQEYLYIDKLFIDPRQRRIPRALALNKDIFYTMVSGILMARFCFDDIEHALRLEVDALEYLIFTIQDAMTMAPVRQVLRLKVAADHEEDVSEGIIKYLSHWVPNATNTMEMGRFRHDYFWFSPLLAAILHSRYNRPKVANKATSYNWGTDLDIGTSGALAVAQARAIKDWFVAERGKKLDRWSETVKTFPADPGWERDPPEAPMQLVVRLAENPDELTYPRAAGRALLKEVPKGFILKLQRSGTGDVEEDYNAIQYRAHFLVDYLVRLGTLYDIHIDWHKSEDVHIGSLLGDVNDTKWLLLSSGEGTTKVEAVLKAIEEKAATGTKTKRKRKKK